MSNTVKLEGESLFKYLVTHFKMEMNDALWSMVDNEQDMQWFDCLDERLKVDIRNNDQGITDYIRG